MMTVMQMNLSDGGKNRKPAHSIGLSGCRSVLEKLGRWRDGMQLKECRLILWQWSEVLAQMSRLEQLCHNNGIILVYESKAHPGFNPTEVRLSSEITCVLVYSNNNH